MLKFTYTLDTIDDAAKRIIDYCDLKTILFYGEMGSGKTTLIKSIIKTLGCTDKITSPTFSIVNEYQAIDGKPIFHFDFYRINSRKEVHQLGLDDYFNSNSWILIEWPENINDFLPTNRFSTEIKSLNYETRLIRVS